MNIAVVHVKHLPFRNITNEVKLERMHVTLKTHSVAKMVLKCKSG